MLDINFEADDTFVNLLNDGMNMVSERAANPLLYLDWIYEHSSVCTKIRKAHHAANLILNKYIGEDLNARREDARNETQFQHNFLSQLLLTETNGRPLTYEEIAQNIKTVCVAVHFDFLFTFVKKD